MFTPEQVQTFKREIDMREFQAIKSKLHRYYTAIFVMTGKNFWEFFLERFTIQHPFYYEAEKIWDYIESSEEKSTRRMQELFPKTFGLEFIQVRDNIREYRMELTVKIFDLLDELINDYDN
jgi:hypothetical protein